MLIESREAISWIQQILPMKYAIIELHEQGVITPDVYLHFMVAHDRIIEQLLTQIKGG